MIRLGIVGTESSHANGFIRYYNTPDARTGRAPYPDIRVTAAVNDSPEASKLQDLFGGIAVVPDAQALMEQTDAVILTLRRGSQHLEAARPFLERGFPMFLDKPFASSVEDAEELCSLIEQYGAPVLAGSGCKFSKSVLEIKNRVQRLRAEKSLVSACLNFPIYLDSPYDGFWFYAPHLVEICLEIFGRDIQAVNALQRGKSVLASIAYGDCLVSLHFSDDTQQNTCLLLTNEQAELLPIDISDCIAQEAAQFAALLYGQRPTMRREEMETPVQVIHVIQTAMETHKEISFSKSDY